MIKKVELLAPVKDRECQQAVIENGADSVYMGYQQFNARMFGKNFNESEFRENIKYAHENNVKVYLTLNTLIREDEMHLALQMATQAVKDHVDGLLVQDIGLASEIRKNISYAGLHASTQMSVSNHYGVKVLHDMGFQRVVLARELNYQEANAIKQICLESNDMSQMEIEVFIHGGLCIAYSGQCFSSSYCFGSSANRGRCLMTCWKGYELKAGKKVLERGSLLRPRDLEGLYGLKHLMEGEIDCLKIQGRLRNSNYIGEIVNVYRHAIDDIFEKRESENKKKIYNSRLWAVSPRGLTSGNLLPEADRNLIMDTNVDVLPEKAEKSDSKKVIGSPQNKKIAVFLQNISPDKEYSLLRKDIDWVYIKYESFLLDELKSMLHELCRKYRVCIYMPPMIYERNCETVYDKVDAIVKNYAIKGIVLSNVSDLMLIGRYVGKCLEYISGNDLHIYNHFTADSLMKMGVRMGTYSLELPFDGCAELKEHTSLPMQQIVFGHSESMHMKYCLLSHSNECDNCGRCKDEKYGNLELNGEAEFYVKINKFQTETVLYSKKTFSADTTRVVGDSLRFDFMNESVLQMNSIIEDIKSGWFYTGREYVNEILKGE